VNALFIEALSTLRPREHTDMQAAACAEIAGSSELAVRKRPNRKIWMN
jgi:hypothetical protein